MAGQFVEAPTHSDNSSDKTTLVFYNYHSVPIPHSGFESLLKFVTSQLSVTLLRFFFCCDVRTTPTELIDLAEKAFNCEIVHIGCRSTVIFDEEVSKKILKLTAESNPGQLVLISDQGHYNSLMNGLPEDWELVIFYPPGTTADFHGLADHAYQLPVTLDGSTSSGTKQLLPSVELHEVNKKLSSFVKRMENLNISVTKAETDKETLKLYKESSPDLLGKWTMEPPEEQKRTVEKKKVEKMMLHQPVMDNGWDCYQESDMEPVIMINGWNEVDQAMTTEQQIHPSGGSNPFVQEKENFFGALPVDIVYNQDLYETGRKLQQQSPHIEEKRMNPFNQKQNNPFGRQTDPTQNNVLLSREQRNPFGVLTFQQWPIQTEREKFTKPAPQCPQWEDRVHRAAGGCTLWHPHKQCMFYPLCRVTAADCGYAHPFCTDGECQCEGMRNPQLNHFFAEE